jgi:hypothetical protein
MKINGAPGGSSSELVVLGGAGDRDRTGMTSLEDRWHGPTCELRNPPLLVTGLRIPVSYRGCP